MSRSFNRATLIGNVGADPEIRQTQGGSKVANFSVATSVSWKDSQTGEKREVTQWHRIVVWNEGLTKVVEDYVRKGQRLLIEGEIQYRKWQDQSGRDCYMTEIVLSGFGCNMIMLDKTGGGASDPNGNANRPGNSAGSAGDGQSGHGGGYGGGFGGGSGGRPMDDEIPF